MLTRHSSETGFFMLRRVTLYIMHHKCDFVKGVKRKKNEKNQKKRVFLHLNAGKRVFHPPYGDYTALA